MKLTIKECKDIQAVMSLILQAGKLEGRVGLCYELAYITGYNIPSYDIMYILMDNDQKAYRDGMGPLGELNDRRVNFLILFTTITPQDLQKMLVD